MNSREKPKDNTSRISGKYYTIQRVDGDKILDRRPIEEW